jgi:hypothetical protein
LIHPQRQLPAYWEKENRLSLLRERPGLSGRPGPSDGNLKYETRAAPIQPGARQEGPLSISHGYSPFKANGMTQLGARTVRRASGNPQSRFARQLLSKGAFFVETKNRHKRPLNGPLQSGGYQLVGVSPKTPIYGVYTRVKRQSGRRCILWHRTEARIMNF